MRRWVVGSERWRCIRKDACDNGHSGGAQLLRATAAAAAAGDASDWAATVTDGLLVLLINTLILYCHFKIH